MVHGNRKKQSAHQDLLVRERYGTRFAGCVGNAEEEVDCERRGGVRTQKEAV